ncbi:MAG: hypothetical protein IJE23_07805 [Tyzzerella sp.]|nr:hypothetical protein [Tyzzerella sp.]
MTINTIITILVIIVALVGLGIAAYLYFKQKKLSEIRADVYQLFLEAEHRYTETKQGKQKLKWVVSRARGLLPDWIQIFITEAALEKIIDLWFKAVKDLLDDGKYNKSVKR